MILDKIKYALINDWSVGGSGVAAISTAAIDKTEVFHWLPWLSQEAAYFLPILGVALILVQLYFKIKQPKDD